MSAIRYLLDEHVDPRLKAALKKIAPEIIVWRVGDPGAPAIRISWYGVKTTVFLW